MSCILAISLGAFYIVFVNDLMKVADDFQQVCHSNILELSNENPFLQIKSYI